MTRKWLINLVPVIFFIISISVMAGGSVLKNPLGENDHVFDAVQQIEHHAKNEDWTQARERARYAVSAWEKVVNRIQFSVERDHMIEISGTLARIQGGVEARDKNAILEEVYYFYDLWRNLG